HFRRLKGLLDGGGYAECVTGGVASANAAQRYLPPTIVRGVSPDAPVMQEEIFGPILPVIAVPSIESAISFVNQRPKPLSLYVFTSRGHVAEEILARTSSGSACVNTCIVQLAVPDLPFGDRKSTRLNSSHV